MRKTMLIIQGLLDDIRSDVALLNIDLLVNKIERVQQLLEGVIRETEDEE